VPKPNDLEQHTSHLYLQLNCSTCIQVVHMLLPLHVLVAMAAVVWWCPALSTGSGPKHQGGCVALPTGGV